MGSWSTVEVTEFDNLGYKIIRNLYNPILLKLPMHGVLGKYSYRSSNLNNFKFKEEDSQVPGSIGCYTHPFFELAYDEIKPKIEQAIGEELYKTFYYNRFYFSGQKLQEHKDRKAAEVVCSIHIESTIEEQWPVWIKTLDDNVVSIKLNPGDGVIYKGAECSHWRHSMPGDGYYHQIVMCFVLANGNYAGFAGDGGLSRREWTMIQTSTGELRPYTDRMKK